MSDDLISVEKAQEVLNADPSQLLQFGTNNVLACTVIAQADEITRPRE